MPGGRPRKPTALKVLQGNPGKRAINTEEPKFQPSPETPPDWLLGAGRELWQRLAPQLIATGVLTDVDRDLFASGCERWGVYHEASKQVESLVIITPSNGAVANPLLAIAKSALADAMAVFREFGIGASSRSKVKATAPAEVDEFARAFG